MTAVLNESKQLYPLFAFGGKFNMLYNKNKKEALKKYYKKIMEKGAFLEREKQNTIDELIKKYPKNTRLKHIREKDGAVEIRGFYPNKRGDVVAKVEVESYDREKGEIVSEERIWKWRDFKKKIKEYRVDEGLPETELEDKKEGSRMTIGEFGYVLKQNYFKKDNHGEWIYVDNLKMDDSGNIVSVDVFQGKGDEKRTRKNLSIADFLSEMENYEEDVIKEKIKAELRSDIPLTWDEFRKKFKEHQNLISRDKSKREDYFNEEGGKLVFFKYDQATGKVYVFSGDFEKGRKAQEISIEGFENMLKLYFPKKVAEEKWGVKAGESDTEGKEEDEDAEKKLTPKEHVEEEEGVKEKYTDEEINSMKKTRAASEYTLNRIDNWEELNAASEKEGDEIFLEKTREIWKEFTVHGFPKKDKDGNEIPNEVSPCTDLDGRAALELLRLAGIKEINVKYIKQGDIEEGKINVDTGNRDGVVSEGPDPMKGHTLIVDHHGENSDIKSSATKHMYELLVSMGLLKKEAHLDKIVDFVTTEDNKEYFPTDLEKNFRNSHRTLLGLEKYIDIRTIFSLLKSKYEKNKNYNPALQNLPESFLKSYQSGYGKKKVPLMEISKKRKGAIESSIAALRQMEKDGLVVDTKNEETGEVRYGKIAVDIFEGGKRKVELGYDAAIGCGLQGYLIWSPESNSFFLSTLRPIKEDFSQGTKVRGRMYIKPRSKDDVLTVKLPEMLGALSGGKFEATGELKKYLEKEMDMETDKEKKEWSRVVGFAIESYIDAGMEYMKLLKSEVLAPLSGNTKEEKEESLRRDVENFVREGLRKMARKFSDEEIEHVTQESLNIIFSNK